MRAVICLILAALALILPAGSRGETADSIVPLAPADTVAADTTVRKSSSTRWIKQLISNGFHINDPGVDYPKFPRFLLKVYNWGDRTFNSYDSTYVIPTGKNWKLQLKDYNWLQYSTMLFQHNQKITMHSDIYCDAGAYLSFMAVSVGYMFNINELIGHPSRRKTFSLDFTCSRFSGNIISQSSEGGMTITRFGNYLDGKNIRCNFEGSKVSSLTGEIFYFFNHRRYSRAAAYCYSKLQLKSAGTWILGATFAKQSTELDFSELPEDMLDYLPLDYPRYSFRYNDYALLGGYGFNWVIRPRKWLVNVTGLVAMGYKHSYEQSTDGRRDMVANNVEFASSVIYNHKSLFAAVNLRMNGFLYYTSKFTYLNSFSSLTATVGYRF